MRQKRSDATLIHTHTFPLDDLPTAIRYAGDRVEDAIKVVVKAKMDAVVGKVSRGIGFVPCRPNTGDGTFPVPVG